MLLVGVSFFLSLLPKKSPSSTSMATRRTPGAGREGCCGGEGTMGCCLAAAAAPLGDAEEEAAADGAADDGEGEVELLRPAELDFATSKPPPELDDGEAPLTPRPLGGRDRGAWARTAPPRTACRAPGPRVDETIESLFKMRKTALSLNSREEGGDTVQIPIPGGRRRECRSLSRSKSERGKRKTPERRVEDGENGKKRRRGKAPPALSISD